jgi:hypothetical protein
VIYGYEFLGFRPERKISLARCSSNYELQTHPLVREVVPQEKGMQLSKKMSTKKKE